MNIICATIRLLSASFEFSSTFEPGTLAGRLAVRETREAADQRPTSACSLPVLDLALAGTRTDGRTDRDGEFCWPCDLPFVALINAFQTFPLLSSSIVMSVSSASESFSLSQWTFSYPSFRTFVPSLFFVISKFGRFAVCRTCRQAGGLAGRLTAAGRWAGYESLALGAADPLDRLAGRSDLDFRQ